MEKGSMSAVYFNRLQEDAVKVKKRPELLEIYNAAMANYIPLSSEVHGFGGASRILAMAAAEAAKEQEMLRQIFGVPLNIDLSRPGAIKELTETINDVFKFRAIYERNKALITSEEFKGEKGVFSYFSTYFIQALRPALPGISRDIKSIMLSNHSIKAGDAAKQAFTTAMPRIIDNAVKRMFGNADVELKGSMDEKHKEAYREIIQMLQAAPRNSVFTQALYQAWGLDEVINQFSDAFSNSRRRPTKNNMEKARQLAEAQVQSSMSSKGGASLEALIDQCIAMVVDGINQAPNVTATAGTHRGLGGGAKARADNVFYFNMNGASIDAAIQQVIDSNSDRETAVKAFSRLGEQLSNVKDGFIVYFNDKNYTLNDNFLRRGGMSAGTAWNLYQVQNILGGIVGNIDQVVYNILQNGAGAIMAGDTANTSKVLAEGIAYYLFDDYSTLGNPGGNAIHIMGLQGMLIPLSAFLYALGTAIQTVEQNASAYVQVTISPAAIDDSDENSYYIANWNRQYNASMSKTKISIHFMENFVGFVKGFL